MRKVVNTYQNSETLFQNVSRKKTKVRFATNLSRLVNQAGGYDTVAQHLGVTPRTIRYYCDRKSLVFPKSEQLPQLSKALGASIDELFQ